MGTKLQFSIAFHPPTDGEIEVVNRSLGNLLRCLAGENLRTWDLVLYTAEFTFNSSINRTIRMSPFEVLHGYQSRKLIDLIPIASHHARMFELAASFVSHIMTCIKRTTLKLRKDMQIIKLMQICTRKHISLK